MRIIPVVWFLLALFGMVALDRWLPLVTLLPDGLRLLGHAAMAAGLLLVVAAAWVFRNQRTPVRPFAEAEVLVTGGPFRLSRNPIYLGMLLVLIGGALRMGTLTPWLLPPVFVVIMNRLIIADEEEMLRRKFPGEYGDYEARVRRWL